MTSTKVTKFVWNSGKASDDKNNVVSLPLSPGQAKERVLAHWDYLDRLCKQRFPHNSNLAHEGLLFILEQFEKDDWRRIRTWQGKGRFSTYVTTLSSRLLTDFQRKKQGHIRLPTWLKEKSDPIWAGAYQLLNVEGLPRQEVINKLQTIYPHRESWFIDEVVISVIGNCDIHLRAVEQTVDCEVMESVGSADYSPETELSTNEEAISAVLWQLLQNESDLEQASNQQVSELTARLKPHLQLDENDLLLLRLRFVDGLKVTKIAQLMNFGGDPYKRLNKILDSLRKSFRQANMSDFL